MHPSVPVKQAPVRSRGDNLEDRKHAENLWQERGWLRAKQPAPFCHNPLGVSLDTPHRVQRRRLVRRPRPTLRLPFAGPLRPFRIGGGPDLSFDDPRGAAAETN